MRARVCVCVCVCVRVFVVDCLVDRLLGCLLACTLGQSVRWWLTGVFVPFCVVVCTALKGVVQPYHSLTH